MVFCAFNSGASPIPITDRWTVTSHVTHYPTIEPTDAALMFGAIGG